MKSKNQRRREKRKIARQSVAEVGSETNSSTSVDHPADRATKTESATDSAQDNPAPNSVASGDGETDSSKNVDSAANPTTDPATNPATDPAMNVDPEDCTTDPSPAPGDPATTSRTITMLSRKYEWMREDDPLYPMYAAVSAKLKRKRADEKPAPPVKAAEPAAVPPPSKKQQRLAAKPSLAYLKSLSAFPERIQWYDADAPHPEFLVRLKSMPRAVQVPSHWLARQDIPQFAPRPPYTPPKAIQKVSFGSKVDADGTPVKPDVAAADVDYAQLHAAFFDKSEDFVTNLLPFGRIAELNSRRAAFKPSQLPVSRPPASLSPRLRTALGLSAKAAPPWSAFVAEHGLAPGYQQAEASSLSLWGEPAPSRG